MSHEIWVVVDNETGNFMKKYQWSSYYSDKSRMWPDKLNPQHFTNKLGRARVFESEKVATNAVPCWRDGGGWISNGLVRVVKLTCVEEKTPN